MMNWLKRLIGAPWLLVWLGMFVFVYSWLASLLLQLWVIPTLFSQPGAAEGLVILDSIGFDRIAKAKVAEIASDIYPMNHIVVGGETGLLANPAEPEAFAAALIDLLENPELAHRLGEAGRRRCQQEFSEEKMMQSTESLYFSLTGCSPDVAPQRSR